MPQSMDEAYMKWQKQLKEKNRVIKNPGYEMVQYICMNSNKNELYTFYENAVFKDSRDLIYRFIYQLTDENNNLMPIGFLDALKTNIKSNAVAELKFSVLPSYSRSKVFTEMLEMNIEEMKKRGIKKLLLPVFASDNSLTGIARRNGFFREAVNGNQVLYGKFLK